MPWALRNGRKYFYVSQRDGNKVRKIYIGGGDIGRAAELTLDVRKERQERVRTWLQETAATYAELDAIDAELVIELSAYLYATHGFVMDAQPARRTMKLKGISMIQGFPKVPLPAAELAKWNELRLRAGRGYREAAAELLPVVEQHPELQSRWGDLSRIALNRWLTLIAGTDEVALKALHAEVLELIRSVRSDSAGQMEDLLARRVGLLWLQMHYFDIQVAAAMPRTPKEQEFLAKRQTATEKAYAEAISTLRDFKAGVKTKLGRRMPKK